MPNVDEADAATKLLNKKERELISGKPKQPLSAYNLFVRDHLIDKSHDFKTARKAYLKLNASIKAKYDTQAEKVIN